MTYSFYFQKFTKCCWTRSMQFSPLSKFPFLPWCKRCPYIFLTATRFHLLNVVGVTAVNVCMNWLSSLTSEFCDINRWGFDSETIVAFNRNPPRSHSSPTCIIFIIFYNVILYNVFFSSNFYRYRVEIYEVTFILLEIWVTVFWVLNVDLR